MNRLGPYELNRVHCVHSLDALPRLPSQSIGSIITDPMWPDTKVFADVNPGRIFQGVTRDFRRLATRVAIHLGCDSDPRMLQSLKMPFFRVCWLRYARPHYKGRLLYGADVAYLYGSPPKSRKGNQVIAGEVCKTQSTGKTTSHPCERSIEHVQWLVNIWSEEDDIVLDPFAGSGTTGVACMQLGRQFIGFEINQEYCDIANQRIQAAEKGITINELEAGQKTLFSNNQQARRRENRPGE